MPGVSKAIRVDQMTIDEACALFKSCGKLDHVQNENVIISIVEELGRLALAINLAGQYVCQTPRIRSNITEFLPEYRQRRGKLLSKQPRNIVDRYSQSVLTTWEISFRHVKRRNQAAVQLLGILSCIDSGSLSADIFDITYQSNGELEMKMNEETPRQQQAVAWQQVLASIVCNEWRVEE